MGAILQQHIKYEIMDNYLSRVGRFAGFACLKYDEPYSNFKTGDIVRTYSCEFNRGIFIENSYRSTDSVYAPYEWCQADSLEPVPFWKGILYSLIMLV